MPSGIDNEAVVLENFLDGGRLQKREKIFCGGQFLFIGFGVGNLADRIDNWASQRYSSSCARMVSASWKS